MDKKEILKIYERELGGEYVNLYFHSDFEGLQGVDLFEDVLKLMKNKKIVLYRDL